jgi:hypothetical protein
VANQLIFSEKVVFLNSLPITLPAASTDPVSGNSAGDMYYSTSTNGVRIYNGSTWQPIQGTSLTGFTLNNHNIIVGNSSNLSAAVNTSLTGDVTADASAGLQITAIQANPVSGTTGTGNVAFATSPSISGAALSGLTTITDAATMINVGTPSKVLAFSLSSMSASTTLTLVPSQTTSQNLFFPNITSTDTLAVLSLAQTFLNKTISAGGSNFIGATAISGTTGTGSIVFSASPTFTGTIGGANALWSGTNTAAAFVSASSNPAATGVLRLASGDAVAWRNNANSADILLSKNTSDALTWAGNVIANSSGVVPPTSGGTGLSSYNKGDTLYASASNTLSALGIGSQYQVLQVGGSTVPTWGALNLAQSAAVTGLLGMANGGTGIDTHASTGVPSISTGTWSVDSQLPTSLGGLGGNFGSSTGALSISSGTVTAGTLPIADGGTNATTAAGAIANLSPQTTKGDLLGFSTAPARIPVGSDGQILVADSSQTTGVRYTTLAQGAKNYVTYNNFENNATTGWSLQNTTLSSKFPNQASGSWTSASGNLSISTVSSGQLADSYSLSYASSAATAAGDMLVSQAYTIDAEDQAKVLTFKFYYEAESNSSNCNFSGTSSNSFGVAIYDVANSAWIMPAGVWGMTQGSSIGYCTGTFQTPSNMTSFRIAIFNANATSGAATLYVDDFYVGPQTAPFGPALTDWNSSQSWTPTGSWSTNTTYTGYWRRVGGDAEFKVKITLSGAPTSATLTVNLPTGMTFDTSRMPGTTTGAVTTMDGEGSGKCAGTASKFYVTYSSTSAVQVNYQSSTAAAGTATDATHPGTFANGDEIDLMFRGPISGWSSNCQMSNDTDTRVVSLVVAPGTNSGSLSAAENVTTFGGSVTQDTHGAFSTANTYTVPVTGFYDVFANLEYSNGSNSSGNTMYALIYHNGSAYRRGVPARVAATGTTLYSVSVSAEMYCVAGDTIQIGSYNAASTPTFTNTTTGSYLNISRRSGPAVVAATESVNARYYSSTTSINGTPAAVTYATKDFDSHNAYSGGTYTVPVSGKYQVNAGVVTAFTSTTTNSGAQGIYIYKNGSSKTESFTNNTTSQTNLGSVVSDVIACNAGDTIQIYVYSNATSPSILSSNVANFFSIARVGN